jgi:hypothetical protein
MEVAFAFLANFGEITPDGRLNVIGGDIDALNSDEVPFTFPLLCFVAKLLFDPEELGRELEIATEIVDPSGEPVSPRSRGSSTAKAATTWRWRPRAPSRSSSSNCGSARMARIGSG